MAIASKLQCNNFSVPYFVDKTLVDSIECCPLIIDFEEQMQLLYDLADAGISEFILDSSEEKPLVWEQCWRDKERGILPLDAEFTYKVPLNRWEDIFDYFCIGNYPSQWISETIFSFTMDSYDGENQTFIHAITAFKRLGAKTFKVSIDNVFVNGITPTRYFTICQQINIAESYGVKFIRINDTLGLLKPAETLTLCSTLVRHYPRLIFCLNTYNGRGFALSNIMMSLQSGFQMLESSFVSHTNTPGPTITEKVLGMCTENKINVGKRIVDKKLLSRIVLLTHEKIMPTSEIYFPTNNTVSLRTTPLSNENNFKRKKVELH